MEFAFPLSEREMQALAWLGRAVSVVATTLTLFLSAMSLSWALG